MVRGIYGRGKDYSAANPDPDVREFGEYQEADNGREGKAGKVEGQNGSCVCGREGAGQEPLIQRCKDSDASQKQDPRWQEMLDKVGFLK